MATFRSKEAQEIYDLYRKGGGLDECPMCNEKPLEQFTLWKVMANAFPYDRIARSHHMLVPKRHVRESELTPEELSEFITLKNSVLNGRYDYFLEATDLTKTIPGHYHLHLVVVKENFR